MIYTCFEIECIFIRFYRRYDTMIVVSWKICKLKTRINHDQHKFIVQSCSIDTRTTNSLNIPNIFMRLHCVPPSLGVSCTSMTDYVQIVPHYGPIGHMVKWALTLKPRTRNYLYLYEQTMKSPVVLTMKYFSNQNRLIAPWYVCLVLHESAVPNIWYVPIW